MLIIAAILLLATALPLVTAHTGTGYTAGDASVRVVSADPTTRTYTFRCVADPANDYLRDWFIRPDDGIAGDEPEIAEFPDRAWDQDITYTFPQQGFYHVGCNIVHPVNTSQLLRGDLHLDLRADKQSWNPQIVPLSGSSLTATLRCDADSGATPSWEVLDARTHARTSLGTGAQKTYTAPYHGLFDFFCTADGNTVPLPVEFFAAGTPYFPDEYGIPVSGGVCAPTTEVCDQKDNDCDGTVDEDNVCGGACYNSVQAIPATCTGGAFTTDSWNGCRTLICASGSDSMRVLACDKSDNAFEMYKQSQIGSSVSKICIGQTCISTGGFAKSASFPICMNSTAPPVCAPTTEVCDQKDNDCDGTVDEDNVCGGTGACYAKVQDIPLVCNGGTVTQDTFNGCRTVVCASGGNSIKVLACDKPTTASAEYFEMYRQAASGTPPQVCLGPTCIQNEGFQRSGHYPICTGTSPPACAPTTEVCDQKDNDCDGLADEGGVCGTSACYTSVKAIPATCEGASITQDTYSGCRTIVCGTTKVLACDKPSSTSPQYFEMYKQAGGTGIKVCLGSACIKEGGYARSADYPVCTAGSPGTVSWIEPVEGQMNTPPNFFHLNVEVPQDQASISSAEWEIWDQAQTGRVWYASKTGDLRFHSHTPDGAFQGILAGQTQLAYSTAYKVRTRWHYVNGSVTPWSSWRTFTTSPQQTGTSDLWNISAGFQVERVATGFDKPVHIAFAPRGMYASLPDDVEPHYYVTELYGKVKVVHKDGSIGTYASGLLNFDPFGSITGGGQMGTIGLYVDDATGDLYVGTVYVENDEVKNKVIRFTSADDGNSFTAQQVIISGLPSAPSHQIEQISKGPDGMIYVALGDALDSANAQSDTILAGKIIRMNPDGSGVQVYAKGLRNPFGHDWRPGTGQLFSTDNSPNTNDRLLKIAQGENYLWGAGDGYIGKAIDLLNPSPVDVEFNPGGSGFPAELDGRMYVAVAGPIYAEGPTNGKEIIEYTLDAAGSIIGERHLLRYTGSGYTTPIGMDFGPDGLYFTDIYGESGSFSPPEGSIYRIVQGTGGCVGCGGGTFRAGLSIVNWYPKYVEGTNELEYLFECKGLDGSGSYTYDFDWGDGSVPVQYSVSDRQGHRYPRTGGPYTVTCRARDQGTGLVGSASMTIDPRDFVDDGIPGNDY